MARGKTTPPEKVYKVMASYAVTNNYSQTARDLKMPVKTVETLVKDNIGKEEFAELCKQKKKEFADRCMEIIDKAMERLENEIADPEASIMVNHLTTVIGTLYDKRALALGENTENTGVTIKLPKGVEEYAE